MLVFCGWLQEASWVVQKTGAELLILDFPLTRFFFSCIVYHLSRLCMREAAEQDTHWRGLDRARDRGTMHWPRLRPGLGV